MFVAVFLYKHIKRVTVLVNGPPQVVQFAPDRDEHFIKEPSVAKPTPALLQLARIFWPKSVAPLSDRFVGNLDPTFRQEIFDVTVAEAEAVVQPNGVTDDFRWKSLSMIVCFGVFHGFSLPNLGLT